MSSRPTPWERARHLHEDIGSRPPTASEAEDCPTCDRIEAAIRAAEREAAEEMREACAMAALGKSVEGSERGETEGVNHYDGRMGERLATGNAIANVIWGLPLPGDA